MKTGFSLFEEAGERKRMGAGGGGGGGQMHVFNGVGGGESNDGSKTFGPYRVIG